MIGNMTVDKLNIFFSIRKFEEKNYARLGKPGELAKTLTKEANSKKEFFRQNPELVMKEYSKMMSQVKIPASVPLNLPESVIELIKRGKVEKITVSPDPRTNKLKIAMVTKTGQEKILVDKRENSFKNNSHEGHKVGLAISENSDLTFSVPRSPLSLESNSSRNQGNALYKMGSAGVEKHV